MYNLYIIASISPAIFPEYLNFSTKKTDTFAIASSSEEKLEYPSPIAVYSSSVNPEAISQALFTKRKPLFSVETLPE